MEESYQNVCDSSFMSILSGLCVFSEHSCALPRKACSERNYIYEKVNHHHPRTYYDALHGAEPERRATARNRRKNATDSDRHLDGAANTEQSTNTPVNATYEPTEPHPEPVSRKIRKSGTGCIYQINDHLWEGGFYPRLPNGKRKKFNVYAESRDQCEVKLAEMIAEKKAEIAEKKAKLKEGAD